MTQVLLELVHAALITSLVFVMMAFVELVSVRTRGRLAGIAERGPQQYVLASFLGATPGCAGAYLVDSMYSRGAVSLGAVSGALLATAGDEAFLMLALFPKRALLLFAGLFIIGIGGGWLTDVVLRRLAIGLAEPCAMAELHAEDLATEAPPRDRWRLRPRFDAPAIRFGLVLLMVGLTATLFTGAQLHAHGHGTAVTTPAGHGDLETAMFITVTLAGVALVLVAPKHYLEEHLWHHLFLHHAPRIFAWTAAALVGVSLLGSRFSLDQLVVGHGALLLIGASLLGLIPISGPHIIVVALFASGQAPLSVLVANSLVQDGHALLPLLGIAPRDAVVAKAANLVIGVAIGAALMAAGW
jgi:hypothetical protein